MLQFVHLSASSIPMLRDSITVMYHNAPSSRFTIALLVDLICYAPRICASGYRLSLRDSCQASSHFLQFSLTCARALVVGCHLCGTRSGSGMSPFEATIVNSVGVSSYSPPSSHCFNFLMNQFGSFTFKEQFQSSI